MSILRVKVPKSRKWARRRARKRVLRREKMLEALARPGADFLKDTLNQRGGILRAFLEVG